MQNPHRRRRRSRLVSVPRGGLPDPPVVGDDPRELQARLLDGEVDDGDAASPWHGPVPADVRDCRDVHPDDVRARHPSQAQGAIGFFG